MKVLIATPTMGSVNVRYFMSILSLEKPCQTNVVVEEGSLVYMARNRLALKAIENGFDYVLWIDSDMQFKPDTLTRLLEDAKQGMDVVTGICFKRSFPVEPVICKSVSCVDGIGDAEIYKDYPRDTVFEIGAMGLGCCLMKVDLLKQVCETFQCSPFEPVPQLGEDYSLCWRLNSLGVKMYCDSRVKIGHVGDFVYDEAVYNGQRIMEVK
jgi:hypothetical protein